MSVINHILDTLNLISDNGKVIDAGKYFLAKRILEVGYEKIKREGLDSTAITPYVTAILDYRADRSEIKIIKNEQTGHDEVYWYRIEKGKSYESQAIDANADGTKEEDKS